MNAEFVYSHTKLLIEEKVTIEKPRGYNYQGQSEFLKALLEHKKHVAYRRSYPYKLSESKHGEILYEGIDFEIKLTRMPPTNTAPWAEDLIGYSAVPIEIKN